ncbi:MAG: hypothetical protein LBE10_11500 [Treponema sp.]|jgi:hypothetical protein|nr:hypothetical protein [Treponema sp.]
MKKSALVPLFIAIAAVSVFSQAGGNEITVNLTTSFKIDPITGLCGDKYEENSKFVQRFIYSPLITPLQDPYLQNDYKVSYQLSIISELEHYSTRRGWERYEMTENNESKQPGYYSIYKIKIRPGLRFNFYDKRGRKSSFPLGNEDIVFSYRMARVTMDRKFDEYINMNKKNDKTLEINTLLYTKVRAFSRVYCDNEYVYFEMFNQCEPFSFLRMLAYVPVLPAEKMHGDIKTQGKKEYNETRRPDAMTDLKDKDFYDLHKKNKLNILSDEPVGYGQFLVKKMGMSEKGIYSSITLERNPSWFDFLIKGPGGINHFNYRNDNLTINIEGGNKKVRELINEIASRGGQNDLVYNIPVSLTSFSVFDENNNPIDIENMNLDKKEMQISHNLYGLLFGPDFVDRRGNTPMPYDLRQFFGKFIGRTAIQNVIRYGTIDTQINSFLGDDKFFLSDINVKRLYYPFYSGGTKTNSEIDEIYARFEDKDRLSREYISAISGDSVSRLRFYYGSLPGDFNGDEKAAFRNRYMLGYLSENMNRDYSRNLKNEYAKIKDKLNISNNEIKIQIFYSSEDAVCKDIADYYAEVLNDFFKNDIHLDTDIKPQYADYDDWMNKAKDNRRKNIYTFFVYGWNDKLDLLNDLSNQFIDDYSIRNIRRVYQDVIDSRQPIETIIAQIAEKFDFDRNRDALPLPLVSVQNYSIFKKKPDGTQSANPVLNAINNHPDLQMMLLPYYWRER